jgi:radical SAM superfamily enzyme YgiQ (UPF0313 family)
MRITFAAMGTENLSVEAISAVLKEAGHEVSLAFDQSLFNDKYYFGFPFLAQLFDMRDEVVDKIVSENPDVLAFSVFLDNYQWALEISKEVKMQINPFIVFGGIHPTSSPEEVISNDCVDAICIEEGEEPFKELLESMGDGGIDYSIKNMWFKKDGEIIKNELRAYQDIESLPFLDKELFENDVPIRYCYLTVTSRGCPFKCSYCMQNFWKKFIKENKLGPVHRSRSVENSIEELKLMKEKYRYEWVDIKNNTFTADKKWALDFLRRYGQEIGVPLRIMAHPLCIDEEIAKALKDAGCWRVQIGIQTLNERIRREILQRNETNEDIDRGLSALDKYGVGYSVDIIFGLPTQTEDDLIEIAHFFNGRSGCVRITPFFLEYLPNTDLLDWSYKNGYIDDDDLKRINSGGDEHYLSSGSIRDKERLQLYQSYQILYRLMPTTPKIIVDFMLKHRLYRIFRFLPKTITINTIDFFANFLINDRTAFMYVKTYFWMFGKRLKKIWGRR